MRTGFSSSPHCWPRIRIVCTGSRREPARKVPELGLFDRLHAESPLNIPQFADCLTGSLRPARSNGPEFGLFAPARHQARPVGPEFGEFSPARFPCRAPSLAQSPPERSPVSLGLRGRRQAVVPSCSTVLPLSLATALPVSPSLVAVLPQSSRRFRPVFPSHAAYRGQISSRTDFPSSGNDYPFRLRQTPRFPLVPSLSPGRRIEPDGRAKRMVSKRILAALSLDMPLSCGALSGGGAICRMVAPERTHGAI